MNKVPVIRKGTIKYYLSNGFKGGIYFGIFIFLLSLIDNSVINSFYFGLLVWAITIIIFVGLGFTSEEYLKRKIKIKRLYSDKYSFLDKNNFTLHEDLYFEGTYKDYFFRVLPMSEIIGERLKKEIEYILIESFYTFNSEDTNTEKREENMCGYYYIGKVHFKNHCATLLPKDFANPNFEENFEGLINLFKREDLHPISKDEWFERYNFRS